MITRLTATRTIDAPAERIFALLADPARHALIDGSGMLRGVLGDTGPVGQVGDRFVMDMHQDALGGYEMANTILVFEPGRAITWRPEMHRAPEAHPEMGGHGPRGQTYGYELEPDGPGRTVVTQVYDWSAVTAPEMIARMPRVSQEQLDGTLERLAGAVEY